MMQVAATDEVRDAKRALREAMRMHGRALAPGAAAVGGEQVARLVGARLAALGLGPGAVAILFASIPGEIDTAPLARALAAGGVRVGWPRVDGDELDLRFAAAADLRPAGRFRIPEPPHDAAPVPDEAIDVVFVPGLAFDALGGRLGHGRAYYDRLLARVPRARRVGLALAHQVVPRVPVEPHDARLDLLIAGDPAGTGVLLETRARAGCDLPREPLTSPLKELH